MPSIVIAQGGGPTAVINQTLCGAILAARRHDPSVRILGARCGVRGLTAGNVVDLTTIPEAQLRSATRPIRLSARPATNQILAHALISSRLWTG
jgi:6-phosphofructokinase